MWKQAANIWVFPLKCRGGEFRGEFGDIFIWTPGENVLCGFCRNQIVNINPISYHVYPSSCLQTPPCPFKYADYWAFFPISPPGAHPRNARGKYFFTILWRYIISSCTSIYSHLPQDSGHFPPFSLIFPTYYLKGHLGPKRLRICHSQLKFKNFTMLRISEHYCQF